jgi:phosphorylated CTD-interacting factor 1
MPNKRGGNNIGRIKHDDEAQHNNNKKKRRRKIDEVSHLSNLIGFGRVEDVDASLDDCLAELQQVVTEPATRTTLILTEGSSSHNDHQSATVSSPSAVESGTGNESPHPTTNRSGVASWMRRPYMGRIAIESWNEAFRTWADGGGGSNSSGGGSGHGLYPPGLLPNIDEEIARNFKVKELSILLLKAGGKGGDFRMPIFERWLLDSKYDEDLRLDIGRIPATSSQRDPVLPRTTTPDSSPSKRLVSELIEHNMQQEDAERIVAELCRKTNMACQELLSQHKRYRQQSPLSNGDRIEVERKKNDTPSNVTSTAATTVTILYSRKKWKKPFCFKINHGHYERLKDRFTKVHTNTLNTSDASSSSSLPWPPSLCRQKGAVERTFHVLVLAMLLRYSAMSGGQLLDDLRGGGMQGAIHDKVFYVLLSHFPPSRDNRWLEGFASPFNATLSQFGSAVPDLDWHFGSVGRFEDCLFGNNGNGGGSEHDGTDIGECCEANPPFSPAIMDGMANHMIGKLQSATNNDKRLTFVVVVPTVTKGGGKSLTKIKDGTMTGVVVQQAASRSFSSLVSSEYCSRHVRLSAREHGYVEGSQHLRPTQYKQSSYDTSVILLQSPKARSDPNLDLQKLEEDLMGAFASRHHDEIQQRKKKIEMQQGCQT